MLQRTREGHDNSHEGDNDGKRNGTERVVGQCIDDLCSGEDVKADKHYVVSQQHERGEMVCPLLFATSIIGEVAKVGYLGMSMLISIRWLEQSTAPLLHDESPHGHAGEVEEDAGKQHGDDARDPSQYAQAPTLRHDGQADLFASE